MRSLIIPVYNEEKRIGEVIDMLKSNLKGYEIIVVEDGSTDNTRNIALSKGVKVISFKENKGKGFGVKMGFLSAKGKYIGFVDSDKSIKPIYIKKVFDNLKNCDVSIASRYLKSSKIKVKQPFFRRLASRIFNILIVRLLFGLNIHDSQCGCKAMKREAALYLAKNTKSNGFEFDVEMLWRAKKKGYKILEVPIVWSHNKPSTFSLKKGPKMILSLLKIRFS
jgi:glycosyltransferase involved in cell wall biosynthesis